MGSKEPSKCTITNSESDSEAPAPALEARCSSEPVRQVRKRNKALQVRFKDICEAQNEQREAAGRGRRPSACRAAYRKYMTVPARRSIPNVTRSTGVQTSPDLRKRYQTFPFERKKGHASRHVAATTVEVLDGHGNGFEVPEGSPGEPTGCSGKVVEKTRALLHTTQCIATVERHPGQNCLERPLLVSCVASRPCAPSVSNCSVEADLQICSVKEADITPPAKRQLPSVSERPQAGVLRDTGSKVTGPIAWNSLTQVECTESPSARSKRKKGPRLNGLQAQCHARRSGCPDDDAAAGTERACQQIVPVAQDGDLKAQLQVMESLISSSQETIKVLLGVIQELEKGEAHREGLSYRTGQDTANCDTCRNSACIIYSVELDFKQQEDKLLPLMKQLCPTEDSQFPLLPYPQEVFTSTPKRKSKTESKKHARWKLWFL